MKSTLLYGGTEAKADEGAAVGNLGFTPYNATNPSGYITSSASITGNAATATTASTVSDGAITSAKLASTLDLGGLS